MDLVHNCVVFYNQFHGLRKITLYSWWILPCLNKELFYSVPSLTFCEPPSPKLREVLRYSYFWYLNVRLAQFPSTMDWLHQGPADGVENVVVCNKIFIFLPEQRLLTCSSRILESETLKFLTIRNSLGRDTNGKSCTEWVLKPIPIAWISIPLFFIASARSAGLGPLYPGVCWPSVISKVTWQLLK